jgi:hypothetical protein
MARQKQKSSDSERHSRLVRMRSAVAQTGRKLTAKLSRGKLEETAAIEPQAVRGRAPAAQAQARPKRPQTDVPFELLTNAYTPRQTSLKASFRSTGEDHYRDQELADGYVDERWSAEDRFTNKSGDPRIGTHGRSYEPGERRTGRN